ncbi:YadA-like family protein [Escherichia coli]|uniref:YadA-like family protein n=1 Tax=Escherichia coli TaxID=562 RepID=UPI0003FC18BA|nr:YadA-like family protein [Escherichia coli]MBL0859365.1 Adhesin YadA [Escherichia coli]MDC6245608.1 YadA-like family protein [Escherichia coli]MDF8436749.1 YadA-like family protein [Escherichia coli]MDF9007229.1 YadA-like family protein [Escherichia coli]MED8381762.1 YadA-like family protein [Escherichia coli]
MRKYYYFFIYSVISFNSIAADPQVKQDDGVGSNSFFITSSSNTPTKKENVQGTNSVAIGNNVQIKKGDGSDLKNMSDGSVAIGNGASTMYEGTTAVGKGAKATGWRSTAIGVGATTNAESATAMGNGANANNLGASAYGTIAKATGTNSTAIGNAAQSSGALSTALGVSSQSTGHYSAALGTLSKAEGYGSVATGLHANAKSQYGIALGSYSVADRAALDDTMLGAISVGGTANDTLGYRTRQIINLAAGTEDNDAVNVSQLKKEAGERVAGDAATLTAAKNYSDAGNKQTLKTANEYSDAGDAKTLQTAKNYSDTGDERTLNSANNYTNTAVKKSNANTLYQANQYTNQKFSELRKVVDENRKRSDAGIAGAMAMTAIAPVPYKDYSFGMAAGGYRDQGAIAAGINIKTSESSLMKVNASWDSQNGGGIAAGFNVGW